MIHTRYGGSGLGLFICKSTSCASCGVGERLTLRNADLTEITELLGGRIEVQSELGEGSVFRFFIKTRTEAPPSPLAQLVDADVGPRRDPGDTPASGSATISVSSSVSGDLIKDTDWSTYHILIVEDNIINQTVLKRQLLKAGLTCDGKAV